MFCRLSRLSGRIAQCHDDGDGELQSRHARKHTDSLGSGPCMAMKHQTDGVRFVLIVQIVQIAHSVMTRSKLCSPCRVAHLTNRGAFRSKGSSGDRVSRSPSSASAPTWNKYLLRLYRRVYPVRVPRYLEPPSGSLGMKPWSTECVLRAV